ncbi:MAG: hypothetical protein AB1758_31365 [Candidatus Eremiobacterota bacterium]
MKRVFWSALANACAIGFSFLAQLVILRKLGVSAVTDCWYASWTLSFLYHESLVLPASYALTPILGASTEEQRRVDLSSVYLLSLLAGLAAMAAIGLLAGLWVPLMFPRFSPDSVALTSQLVWLASLVYLLQAQNSLLVANLMSRGRTAHYDLVTFCGSTTGLVVSLSVVGRLGIYAFPAYLVARALVEAALLWVLTGPPARPDLTSQGLKRLRDCLPGAVGGAVVLRLDPVLDKVLASLAPPGSLSTYSFLRQVSDAVVRVSYRAAVTPFLGRVAPVLERAQGDPGPLVSLTRQAVQTGMLFSGLLLVALLIGEAVYLTTIGVGWHGMSLGAVLSVQLGLLGVVLCGPLYQFMNTLYHGASRSHTVARYALASLLAGGLCKVASFSRLGILGICLGASVNLTVFLVLSARGVRGLLRR